jgi:hypothetical protein
LIIFWDLIHSEKANKFDVMERVAKKKSAGSADRFFKF